MVMKGIVNTVRTYIEREIGLEAGSLILVALSVGADSTALLLIMKELGYRLHALHCNFHLRGEESNRDQAFVEELCRQQQVPLSVRHFNAEEEAKQRGISIEMAARDLRYAWFREEQSCQLSIVNVQLLSLIIATTRQRRCYSTCFVEQGCAVWRACIPITMASSVPFCV